MLLRQDAVRINFGSKSVWPFATSEGDRILADLAWRWRGGWTEPAGWSLWIWKSLLFGLPPCPRCPSPPDQLYSADSSVVGNRGGGGWKSSLTEHVAKAPTVLALIIDQMIKADEEIFLSVLKARTAIVRLWLVERELPKDQYFQSRQRAPLSVTLSKVITIES